MGIGAGRGRQKEGRKLLRCVPRPPYGRNTGVHQQNLELEMEIGKLNARGTQECKSKTSIEARNVADCCPKLAPLALASLNMHHVFLLPTCYTESLHYHVA